MSPDGRCAPGAAACPPVSGTQVLCAPLPSCGAAAKRMLVVVGLHQSAPGRFATGPLGGCTSRRR